MIIDIPNEKGYVIDTDKIISNTNNLYAIYFSENRAKELNLPNTKIEKSKKDARNRLAWYEDNQFKDIVEEKF